MTGCRLLIGREWEVGKFLLYLFILRRSFDEVITNLLFEMGSPAWRWLAIMTAPPGVWWSWLGIGGVPECRRAFSGRHGTHDG
jgi:hypothetical protein